MTSVKSLDARSARQPFVSAESTIEPAGHRNIEVQTAGIFAVTGDGHFGHLGRPDDLGLLGHLSAIKLT